MEPGSVLGLLAAGEETEEEGGGGGEEGEEEEEEEGAGMRAVMKVRIWSRRVGGDAVVFFRFFYFGWTKTRFAS